MALLSAVTQAASTDHCVRMFFCDEDEDAAQKRLDAGIPLDYAGKVVCVQFVSSPNAIRSNGNGNTATTTDGT